MMLFMIPLLSFSIVGGAEESVNFGYDKPKREIYAESGGKKSVLGFEEDYTGNPTYAFDFFSNSPAIISDGQSLHDYTVYVTLNHSEGKFSIDCLYYNIKSKRNGLLVKEGRCGLNASSAEKYSDYIDKKVNEVENDMDATDTSFILDGKVSYLAIVLFKSKEQILYKLYNNKNNLLDDKYSILNLTSKGECNVFPGNPWIVYNDRERQQVDIMDESVVNGRVELSKAVPEKSSINQCAIYPTYVVKKSKSYFYDSSYKIKNSYLIKGDSVSLLAMDGVGKWCKVRYFNNKNTSVDNIMLCTDLKL
ncbi:hypothetical protein [Yokenella regensburgei]|uniref:hypothetical protein n=1 Tax=Yokenella regensburgei TaxID=158877 RepID=UPI00207764E8|nr:hypothetical protein [Yokenella regensburgei]